MNVEQIVEIRFDNDFAIIDIDDRITLWKIFTRLNDLIEENINDLANSEVVMITGERTIGGGDIHKLYHQIVNKYNLDIVRIFSEATDLENVRDLPVTLESISRLKGFLSRSELFESRSTLFVKRIVRSGQIIDFDGHVVVYGDINPGGMVRATGNVSVFGRLAGSVWAGCGGNDDSFVIASLMAPTQLRISSLGLPGRDVRLPGSPLPLVARVRRGSIEIIDLDLFCRG